GWTECAPRGRRTRRLGRSAFVPPAPSGPGRPSPGRWFCAASAPTEPVRGRATRAAHRIGVYRRGGCAMRCAAPRRGAGRAAARAVPTALCPRFLAFLALSLVAGLSAPGHAQGALPIQSRAAVLMHARSGRVLHEKIAHEPLPPASVTKVFPLVVALEALRDGRVALDDLVVTSARAAGMG